jgi:hypothetical protein
VAACVDDLAIASKNPQGIIDDFERRYKFKLKGTGPIKNHLGMVFFRDEDGVLCASAKSYVDRLEVNYERMFGSKPAKNMHSPLEKGDRPELDTTDLCELDDIVKYQSLIGMMQWSISIGRMDIQVAVMGLSSYRQQPRKGHLERAKRIAGYLCKFRNATIRFRVEEPDYSDIPDTMYDWSKSVYDNPREEIPKDAPEPLGKYVTQTTFKDANLCHNIVNGKAVTGVLHFFNQTPVDSYAKLQATVETATYGSEFSSARTAAEQMVGHRMLLRYLGVPVRDQMFLFGDNKSVVTSSTAPQSTLSKRHQALSYHYVRALIASGALKFTHVPGENNPADILTKH